MTILTNPPGANIYTTPYSDPDAEWEYLGKTPVVDMMMPTWSYFRRRIEKEGYASVLSVSYTFRDKIFGTRHNTESHPERMVYLDGIREEVSSNLLDSTKHGFFS
jgi:hypothetical protein